MQIQKENRIGEVVTQNFHTAKVFESLGLDFCCGGKKSIADACRERGIDADFVVGEVSKVETANGAAAHFEKWEADFLADYIVNNHHSYVLTNLSTIEHHLAKVIDAHGIKHPELSKIDENFSLLKEELLNHMAKEEKMLFPYIKKLNIAYKNTLEMSAPPFGSVGNPIKVMEDEQLMGG
jgi:regulator of cell morphogenesis and NO signaling